MMDKAQALHTFWSSFGLPAYDENTVPGDASLPYITYRVATAAFDEPVAAVAYLWYNSTSWAEITRKADEIGSAISRGGIKVDMDGGQIWVKRDSPFSHRMPDPDPYIRRMMLQCEAEFISED